MKQIFINPSTNIIRAGWRILIFLGIFITINYALTVLLAEIFKLREEGGLDWTLNQLFSATIAAFICKKYLEKEKFSSIGLRLNKLAVIDLLIGISIGAIIMTGMYFTLISLGLIKFEGFTWWCEETPDIVNFKLTVLQILLGIILKEITIASWEEIAFRGILLQNISKGLGLKWGIIITTLIFGIGHAFNPNASILSTFLITITSLLLIYAYLKTGQLWLPIGIHFGWNFFQCRIFGFGGSGQHFDSLICQTPTGPDWLSGGKFGAENSVLVVGFIIISLFIIHYSILKTRTTKGDKLFKFHITDEDFK